MTEKDMCDMCGSKIENNECSCGVWYKDYNDPMKLALEKFHGMKKMTVTGDAPHLGCAVVFFRGDYMDCKAVEDFIHKMKKRPYYQE